MFDFLKYIIPIWYYRLQERAKAPLFTDDEMEELGRKGLISAYRGFDDHVSAKMDLVYQALQVGAIPGGRTPSAGASYGTVSGTYDNYVFIRRHFAAKWSLYVLCLRLLTLHNPFKEWKAFKASRRTSRIRISSDFLYTDFKEHILPDTYRNALVSIVIPTLNRYEYLSDVLSDLEKQDHSNIEVIVCDQSEPFQDDLYKNRPFPVRVIRQEEKALWKARNTCFFESKGPFILLFDDDSRVESDWISQHLRCLSYFNADISAGVTETLVGHGLSEKENRFHMSDVFDTGNAMVRRGVFENVGLFDRQFERQRMGDGEFGLRAYLGGYAVISNPFAKRVHLKGEKGGLRHFGGWDAFRPGRLFSPRPVPSVLYFSRKYFGGKSALYLVMNSLPSSTLPYRYKGKRNMRWMAFLLTAVLSPILAVQVFRSWRIAGRMLDEGPIIEYPGGLKP
jgi:glycosyltransferase involved in cell wall biosynthesis